MSNLVEKFMTNFKKETIYNIIDNKLSYININIQYSSIVINDNILNLSNNNYMNPEININTLNDISNLLKSSFKINNSLNELTINVSNFPEIQFKNKRLIVESFINLFSILTEKNFSKIKFIVCDNFPCNDFMLMRKLFKSITNIIKLNNNLQVLDLSSNTDEHIYYILSKLKNYNLKELKLNNHIQSISLNKIDTFKKLMDFIFNSNVKINTLNVGNNNIDDLSILKPFILNNKTINKLLLDNNNISYIDEAFIENLKNSNIQYISLKNNLFDNDKKSIKRFNTLIEFN